MKIEQHAVSRMQILQHPACCSFYMKFGGDLHTKLKADENRVKLVVSCFFNEQLASGKLVTIEQPGLLERKLLLSGD